MNDGLVAIDNLSKALECSKCFSRSVIRQDDGSYICTKCHAVQNIQDTYDEIDNLQGQESMAYSYKITHKENKEEQNRVNDVVLSEGIQLILACQTVSLEKFMGFSISDSVFFYLTKFNKLIQPPFNSNTFSNLLLILLSGMTHLGIPATLVDLVKWIRDGVIPYYKPVEFLPQSFVSKLSKAEKKYLNPTLVNLNLLLPSNEKKMVNLKMHPLPNPGLFLWRVASRLGVPEQDFVSFCLSLTKTKPIDSIPNIIAMMNDDRSKLYSISKFLRVGIAMPIALSIFAMSLIYRLDGTDWINPHFLKLGFPKFNEILKGILTKDEVIPSFPKIDGHIPHLHSDLIRLMENDDCARIEHSTIVNDVNIGFTDECMLTIDVKTLAELNNDAKVLIASLSRCFGVTQHLIFQQYSNILKKRFGLYHQKKTLRGNDDIV